MVCTECKDTTNLATIESGLCTCPDLYYMDQTESICKRKNLKKIYILRFFINIIIYFIACHKHCF